MGKLTEANVRLAMELTGGVRSAAAVKLQVSRSTLYLFFDNNPNFYKELKVDVDEVVLDLAEGKMLTDIKAGDRRTVRWFLDRKGGSRGYSPRYEHSGPRGEPIAHTVVTPVRKLDLSKMSMKEKKALLAAVREAESEPDA